MNQTLNLSSADRKALRLLQAGTKLSKQELAEAVGMSPSTLWRRLADLEASGAIKGRVALLDPAKVGLPVCVILSVNLVDHNFTARERFEEFVTAQPEIMECYSVTGEFDYLLIIRSESVQGFELFLMNKVLAHKEVASTSSQIALSVKKYSTELPIDTRHR
jgi:Lrp/AsnC family transcriptional regulator